MGKAKEVPWWNLHDRFWLINGTSKLFPNLFHPVKWTALSYIWWHPDPFFPSQPHCFLDNNCYIETKWQLIWSFHKWWKALEICKICRMKRIQSIRWLTTLIMECAFHLRFQVNLLQWRPFQMGAFHSNENGLFCTRSLSVAPLFWWKERGKQEALIWMNNSHLNRTLQYIKT